MQKKFFSNLVLIILLNLLVKPFAIFGIDATVQNRVSTEDYGLYFALLNLTFLFNIVADLGINNYTTKHVAQNPQVVSSYLGKVFSFRLILFVIYSLLTLSIGIGIGYNGAELYMLIVLIFNQLLITLIAYFRSHFGGLHLFKTDALLSVLDKVLLIFICGTILFFTVDGLHFQIEWFIWIQTICYGITLIVAFILLISEIGFPKFKFKWVFSIAILKQSYPYALLILLMMLYTRTDSVMLERLHPNGKHEAGIYAQGFRLLDAFFMFGMIFANLLLPIFSRQLRENKKMALSILKTSGNLLIGGSILIAILCHYNADLFLDLIYKKNVLESLPSFQWLMWGFIGMCISLIYGTLLTANGDLRFMNQLSAVGIVLNIVLNALFIPEYGAAGSAFATLITQGFTSLLLLSFCFRKFSIPVSIYQLLNYAGFIGLLFLIPQIFTDNMQILVLQLSFGTLGMFVFKIIDLKGLKKVFRENE